MDDPLNSLRDPTFTYHFSKYSCMQQMYYAHIFFNYIIMLSGTAPHPTPCLPLVPPFLTHTNPTVPASFADPCQEQPRSNPPLAWSLIRAAHNWTGTLGPNARISFSLTHASTHLLLLTAFAEHGGGQPTFYRHLSSPPIFPCLLTRLLPPRPFCIHHPRHPDAIQASPPVVRPDLHHLHALVLRYCIPHPQHWSPRYSTPDPAPRTPPPPPSATHPHISLDSSSSDCTIPLFNPRHFRSHECQQRPPPLLFPPRTPLTPISHPYAPQPPSSSPSPGFSSALPSAGSPSPSTRSSSTARPCSASRKSEAQTPRALSAHGVLSLLGTKEIHAPRPNSPSQTLRPSAAPWFCP